MKVIQVDTLRREETAPGLKQYQRDALTLLRARLDTFDPGFVGDDEVRAALNSIRFYFDETLLQLDVAAGGSTWKREYNARDVVRVRRRRRIHKLRIMKVNWNEAQRGRVWNDTDEAKELTALEQTP